MCIPVSSIKKSGQSKFVIKSNCVDDDKCQKRPKWYETQCLGDAEWYIQQRCQASWDLSTHMDKDPSQQCGVYVFCAAAYELQVVT